ncbi:MAG: 4'-phosphopantetheinyl transferase superfamily protein [Bacteroidia bacterium]|nr:4'-phosphopantetheinyl transferase superfamily protein [Bacteroidia bacterium]
MPLIAKYIFDKSTIALWYINETSDELQDKLLIDDFIPYKNSKRNIHWLSARIALQETLPHENFKIIKNIHGKPYLENSEKHISITHSGNMAAAIYNSNDLCGIDLEKYDHRISKIANKFTSESETSLLNKDLYNLFCCIIWSGKETVFKYSPLADIDFKLHIELKNIDINNNILHYCFKKNKEINLAVNYKLFEFKNSVVSETNIKSDKEIQNNEHYILTWI